MTYDSTHGTVEICQGRVISIALVGHTCRRTPERRFSAESSNQVCQRVHVRVNLDLNIHENLSLSRHGVRLLETAKAD